MTERRTRATSVAATKAAEPLSRRTRAASVSANKKPETVTKRAAATPKRKRSTSVAAPKAAEATDHATPRRRASGRQKRQKTVDVDVEDEVDDVEEPEQARGRSPPEEPEDGVLPEELQNVKLLVSDDDRKNRRDRLEYSFLKAHSDQLTQQNIKFKVLEQDMKACVKHGFSDYEREQIYEMYSPMDWFEHHDGLEWEREEGDVTLAKMQTVMNELSACKTIEETHDAKAKEFIEHFQIAVADGIDAKEKEALVRRCNELVVEERRLAAKLMEELDMKMREPYDVITEEKLLEMGRRLEEEAQYFGLEGRRKLHREKKSAFTKAARQAIAEGLSDERKAELQTTFQSLAEEEKEFKGKGEIGGELLVMGWRLKGEKTLEERAKDAEEEQVKKTPANKVKGAYFDTTAQGIAKTPLSARAHRIQLKTVADEKEKATKMFEDFKKSFADGLEFYETGGTNVTLIKGYQSMRLEIASLEELFAELHVQEQDLAKIKHFMEEVEKLSEIIKDMDKANATKVLDETRQKITKGREVELVDRTEGGGVLKAGDVQVHDCNELEVDSANDDIEMVSDAPGTIAEPRSKEEPPRKTPRKKAIRLSNLSTFTPGGTRANSETENLLPSSPLSAPPSVREVSPTITTTAGTPLPRAPESISWATPVSEIHDFLEALSTANNVAEKYPTFAFDPRPIGFKCPGHKRWWRSAPQTSDLLIYRDWLNHAQNVGKEQLFGFFMSQRDISKAPGLMDMKSLKDWKAWGAAVVETESGKGKEKWRTLIIYDPELTQSELEGLSKTGELDKMMQLLVGAVKRCRGSCDAVLIEGRGDEEDEEEMVGVDLFGMVARWAVRAVSDGGRGTVMGVLRNEVKKLEIAK